MCFSVFQGTTVAELCRMLQGAVPVNHASMSQSLGQGVQLAVWGSCSDKQDNTCTMAALAASIAHFLLVVQGPRMRCAVVHYMQERICGLLVGCAYMGKARSRPPPWYPMLCLRALAGVIRQLSLCAGDVAHNGTQLYSPFRRLFIT